MHLCLSLHQGWRNQPFRRGAWNRSTTTERHTDGWNVNLFFANAKSGRHNLAVIPRKSCFQGLRHSSSNPPSRRTISICSRLTETPWIFTNLFSRPVMKINPLLSIRAMSPVRTPANSSPLPRSFACLGIADKHWVRVVTSSPSSDGFDLSFQRNAADVDGLAHRSMFGLRVNGR